MNILTEYLRFGIVSENFVAQSPPVVERWTRERRLEHTRALLLDAAEEVFAEKGSRRQLSTTSPICGLHKGAIHKHFTAKEELF